MKIRCSAIILTYNSIKTIRQCLNSVSDFSDIVVFDGGSIDGTHEIASQYGVRIYPQNAGENSAPIVDFTTVRKRAFDLASEHWRLWLDSDEWLSDEARDKIKEIVDKGERKYLYAFLRKAVIGGRIIKYAYFYPEYCRRLFHKDADVSLKKGKKVHENLIVGNGASIKKFDAIIYHNWYERYSYLVTKDDRYLDLTLIGKENSSFRKKLKIGSVNFLKANYVFLRSLLIYIKHGYRDSLPLLYSWRFVRYHLLYAIRIILL